MRNIAAEPLERPTAPHAHHSDRSERRLKPVELAEWLENHVPWLAERWLREIQRRYDPSDSGLNGLLEEFLTLLVSFLPLMLGPQRQNVESLWLRASELFGAVSARRGLAAGGQCVPEGRSTPPMRA